MNKFLNTIKRIQFTWGVYPQSKKRWVVLGATVMTLGLVIGMIFFINTNSNILLPETGTVHICGKDPNNNCESSPTCKCNGRVCGDCTPVEDEPDPTRVPPKPTATPVPTAIPGTLGAVDAPANFATILGNTVVSGWFLDIHGVNTVQIYVDKEMVGTATLGISRPDILAAYPSFKNANAGFSFTLITTKYLNGIHTITVNMIDNATPFVQMSIARSVTINNTIPTATPTRTPTPMIIAAPIVNDKPCFNGGHGLDISWAPSPFATTTISTANIVRVDISLTNTFANFWSLNAPVTKTTAVAPIDSTGNFLDLRSGIVMPVLTPNTTYYVRAWYAAGNVYSQINFITMPPLDLWGCVTTPTVTPTPIVINPPLNLSPSGTINPGVQNISWNPNGSFTSFGLRVNDITDGWDSTCATVIGNDVCKNVTSNVYSYNFLAGHKYSIWVHNISGSLFSSPISVDVIVANAPINAPVVNVICTGTTLSLDINWNGQNLNPQAYWVDISQSSSFVNNFWHKKAVMPAGATSYRATAPVDIDTGYFVEYQYPEPIMPSIQRNQTYYVKIWYHTPIYRSSLTTTVTTPSLCGGM
jgi:hypothetical protein